MATRDGASLAREEDDGRLTAGSRCLPAAGHCWIETDRRRCC